MTLASREAETISSWQALPFFLLEQFLLDNHKNNKMPAIKRQSNANRPKRVRKSRARTEGMCW
jgi:hypothetical protein